MRMMPALMDPDQPCMRQRKVPYSRVSEKSTVYFRYCHAGTRDDRYCRPLGVYPATTPARPVVLGVGSITRRCTLMSESTAGHYA